MYSEPEMGDFRSQRNKLQTGFVHEPRRTVEGADRLLAAVMQRLADGFAQERSGLKSSGTAVTACPLRICGLKRYRSFFGQIAETLRLDTFRIPERDLDMRMCGPYYPMTGENT